MKNKAVQDDTDDSSGEDMAATTPIAVAIPVSDDDNNNAIPSAPPLANVLQSDEEAQATADAAREQGITVIRDHCEQHLRQNPGSSYVTWIATLHPENAQVSIDPRFLIEGNPWIAVYEEAKDDYFQKGRCYNYNSGVGLTVTPPSALPPASVPPLQDGQEGAGARSNSKPVRKFGGFLDFVVGNMLVLLSISATFAFELGASYCYLSYWLCSKIVDSCRPSIKFTWLPVCIAFTISKIFQLLDALLLFASIVFVESIAATNYVISTILACSHEQGKTMHQMTRKLPHLVRWAIRKKLRSGI